jgi:CHAT domain-containing protein
MELARDRILITRQRLGNAYLLDKNPLAAIKTIEPAIAFLDVSGFATSIDEVLLMDLGRAYALQKDFPRALEYLTKALAKAEARQHQSAIPGISNAIGQLYTQFGKPGEALPYYKKAIDSFESTRSFLQSEELRTSFVENKGQTYASIILASLQAKNIQDAFNYNERARSRAFLDILGSKVQLAKKAALVEEEKALQKKIDELRVLASLRDVDDEEGESATDSAPQQQELDAAEKVYADFLAEVRRENREQASLMNVEPLTAKQVQGLLDPEVTVLEYYVANNAVWLWVVEKDRLQYVSEPINRAQLVSKVSSFREAITELQDKDKLDALSQDLYKVLIEPALPFMNGNELLIIPHDVLHYLPFQALLSPEGKYLIEDFAINYLSSASLMQFTQEKRKARGELTALLAKGGSVLTFGNPDLNDRKMKLQFAEIEAKEIKSLYPQSTIYLEKEATEEKAKSLIGNSDIIHFASHAELREDDPLSSAILLAKSDKDDGRLEVREIFGMDLKASLVVLSACETGLGKLSSGDELVGLTRAFIYAGTPSVVASLWNVEDSSTAQLMASFYKNLKTMTKVEALRQAQLNLIRGNVNSDLLTRRGIGGVGKLGETPVAETPAQQSSSISTSHPYFWAPFILVGEGK